MQSFPGVFSAAATGMFTHRVHFIVCIFFIQGKRLIRLFGIHNRSQILMYRVQMIIQVHVPEPTLQRLEKLDRVRICNRP